MTVTKLSESSGPLQRNSSAPGAVIRMNYYKNTTSADPNSEPIFYESFVAKSHRPGRKRQEIFLYLNVLRGPKRRRLNNNWIAEESIVGNSINSGLHSASTSFQDAHSVRASNRKTKRTGIHRSIQSYEKREAIIQNRQANKIDAMNEFRVASPPIDKRSMKFVTVRNKFGIKPTTDKEIQPLVEQEENNSVFLKVSLKHQSANRQEPMTVMRQARPVNEFLSPKAETAILSQAQVESYDAQMQRNVTHKEYTTVRKEFQLPSLVIPEPIVTEPEEEEPVQLLPSKSASRPIQEDSSKPKVILEFSKIQSLDMTKVGNENKENVELKKSVNHEKKVEKSNPPKVEETFQRLLRTSAPISRRPMKEKVSQKVQPKEEKIPLLQSPALSKSIKKPQPESCTMINTTFYKNVEVLSGGKQKQISEPEKVELIAIEEQEIHPSEISPVKEVKWVNLDPEDENLIEATTKGSSLFAKNDILSKPLIDSYSSEDENVSAHEDDSLQKDKPKIVDEQRESNSPIYEDIDLDSMSPLESPADLVPIQQKGVDVLKNGPQRVISQNQETNVGYKQREVVSETKHVTVKKIQESEESEEDEEIPIITSKKLNKKPKVKKEKNPVQNNPIQPNSNLIDFQQYEVPQQSYTKSFPQEQYSQYEDHRQDKTMQRKTTNVVTSTSLRQNDSFDYSDDDDFVQRPLYKTDAIRSSLNSLKHDETGDKTVMTKSKILPGIDLEFETPANETVYSSPFKSHKEPERVVPRSITGENKEPLRHDSVTYASLDFNSSHKPTITPTSTDLDFGNWLEEQRQERSFYDLEPMDFSKNRPQPNYDTEYLHQKENITDKYPSRDRINYSTREIDIISEIIPYKPNVKTETPINHGYPSSYNQDHYFDETNTTDRKTGIFENNYIEKTSNFITETFTTVGDTLKKLIPDLDEDKRKSQDEYFPREEDSTFLKKTFEERNHVTSPEKDILRNSSPLYLKEGRNYDRYLPTAKDQFGTTSSISRVETVDYDYAPRHSSKGYLSRKSQSFDNEDELILKPVNDALYVSRENLVTNSPSQRYMSRSISNLYTIPPKYSENEILLTAADVPSLEGLPEKRAEDYLKYDLGSVEMFHPVTTVRNPVTQDTPGYWSDGMRRTKSIDVISSNLNEKRKQSYQHISEPLYPSIRRSSSIDRFKNFEEVPRTRFYQPVKHRSYTDLNALQGREEIEYDDYPSVWRSKSTDILNPDNSQSKFHKGQPLRSSLRRAKSTDFLSSEPNYDKEPIDSNKNKELVPKVEEKNNRESYSTQSQETRQKTVSFSQSNFESSKSTQNRPTHKQRLDPLIEREASIETFDPKSGILNVTEDTVHSSLQSDNQPTSQFGKQETVSRSSTLQEAFSSDEIGSNQRVSSHSTSFSQKSENVSTFNSKSGSQNLEDASFGEKNPTPLPRTRNQKSQNSLEFPPSKQKNSPIIETINDKKFLSKERKSDNLSELSSTFSNSENKSKNKSRVKTGNFDEEGAAKFLLKDVTYDEKLNETKIAQKQNESKFNEEKAAMYLLKDVPFDGSSLLATSKTELQKAT